MLTSIKNHLIYLIEEELKTSFWSPADAYYKMKLLSIDQRGRIGEHFLRDVFTELNMNVEYIENGHGDFDLIVNGNKIEVKTATLDKFNKFQHEGIKNSKDWDAVAFVDIIPNDLYLTLIPHKDFNFDIFYTNKSGKPARRGTVKINDKIQNIHFRGKDNIDGNATGAGYKVDFSIKDLKITKTIKDIENIYYQVFNK
ncbi:hypothetical protein FJO69_02160 [[Mycoplasma] falconis]|uniref:Restriction endonuclease n=1 Tax=[Mycoplasma] falconis TaxID=92403 RepID=A0A501X9F8_9BACT|nr:hypothetical protein [[Mycoplasma] falconis]TPE57195.1 hypothetical protein FJO69_02160 [[Mycoplasma] falconis]